ncbi:MAG: hypothetical protein AB1649_13390 [Chloroflexota bacterium]
MKKTTYILFALAVFMALFISACGGGQTAPTAAPAPTQPAPVVVQPTQPPAQVIQPTTGPAFAPTCQNVSASCTPPDVKDTVAAESFCVQQVPYQLIFLPEGTTFEVLDPANLTCLDNGAMQDGKHVIECHGTEEWTTELKITNVACGSNTLVTGTGQCQEGYGYDATQACCAPVTTDAGNTTIIKVNMGGCRESGG